MTTIKLSNDDDGYEPRVSFDESGNIVITEPGHGEVFLTGVEAGALGVLLTEAVD